MKANVSKKIKFAVLGAAVLLYPFMSVAKNVFLYQIPYGFIANRVLNVGTDMKAYPIGEIVEGDIIRQSFIARIDHPILSIKINGATYARKNHGYLIICLMDAESQKILKKWEIDVSKMSDNAPIVLKLDEMELVLAQKEYLIEVSSKGGQTGNAVTLYASQKDMYKEGCLFVNGQKQAGDLCFQIFEIAGKRSFLRADAWLKVYAAAAAEIILYLIYTKCDAQKEVNDGKSKV